jgi:hypothetical protein
MGEEGRISRAYQLCVRHSVFIGMSIASAPLTSCGTAPAPAARPEVAASARTTIPDAPSEPPELSSGPGWFDEPRPSPPSPTSEGDVAWATYHFSAPPFCRDERLRVGAGEDGIVVMTSEQDYDRVFCRRSVVDWKRFRVVLSVTMDVETIPVRVFRDGSDVVVAFRRECRNTDFALTFSVAAVVIPAGSEPVRRILVGRFLRSC